jgi:hypothetical protein
MHIIKSDHITFTFIHRWSWWRPEINSNINHMVADACHTKTERECTICNLISCKRRKADLTSHTLSDNKISPRAAAALLINHNPPLSEYSIAYIILATHAIWRIFVFILRLGEGFFVTFIFNSLKTCAKKFAIGKLLGFRSPACEIYFAISHCGALQIITCHTRFQRRAICWVNLKLKLTLQHCECIQRTNAWLEVLLEEHTYVLSNCSRANITQICLDLSQVVNWKWRGCHNKTRLNQRAGLKLSERAGR